MKPIEQHLNPIETWRSKGGEELLILLGREEFPAEATFKRLGLPYWERAMLRRMIRGRKGFARARVGTRRRAWLARMLADELDLLRKEARQHRTLAADQQGFYGNRRHLDLLARSLTSPTQDSEWNAWRARDAGTVPDLRGANLTDLDLRPLRLDGARLADANLSGCSLRVGRLKHADLRRARLFAADLSYADLRNARLDNAWLQDARLTDAKLQKADLHGARLIGCILNRAELQGTKVSGTLVWGTSVWHVERDAKTEQKNISIGWDFFDPADAAAFGAKGGPDFTRVNDIAVADFMSLVSHNRANMAGILDAASSKLVLLLGRFTGKQREVLLALEQALPSFGYVPMVFDCREEVGK